MSALSNFRFRPRLYDSLKGYNRSDLGADLGAGLTVACVALPLAMAFAIASGVKPEQGLITAIVAGLLISLLGGSKVQIGGPAGAFVALLYTIGERYGIANLLLATMMAGVVLFAMGLFKLGQLVRFVPVAIVIGFTNGIAVIIALSQIRDFFGLPIDKLPANFFSQMAVIGAHLKEISVPTTLVALGSLLVLFLWPKAMPKLPREVRDARARAAGEVAADAGRDGTSDIVTLGNAADAAGREISEALERSRQAAEAEKATATTAASIAGAAANPAVTAAATRAETPAAGTPATAAAVATEPPLGSPAEPRAGTVWPRIRRAMATIPGPLAVLVLATLAVWLLHLDVETIGSRFGGIPASLPTPALPTFDWSSAQNLVGPILAIAFLGAIESLLCARIADGMTHERHDPNQELMAQGIANFTVPFFGGIAATGTIARTVTNVRAGARTPVAGVVHALTLLAFMLVLAPLASSIPMAVLAAILVQVAWNMGEWRAFKALNRFPNSYRMTLIATFLLTVVFDLTVAVQVGLVMSCLFFIYRMAALTRIEAVDLPPEQASMPGGRAVTAWRLYGTLFFGSVSKLDQILPEGRAVPGAVILDLHQIVKLDPTGLDELESLHRTLTEAQGRLIIVDANPQPQKLIERSGFARKLGPDNLFPHLEDALIALGGRPLRSSPLPPSTQMA